jgi:SAM-dependent methyltransferase
MNRGPSTADFPSEAMYSVRFYRTHHHIAERSARAIVPLVLELTRVNSVCDVGCGDGAWLRAFAEHGVADLIGIDGEYVRPVLHIPAANFQAMDLRSEIALPRSFDLAVSLEVAEHLPESRAAGFVADLTRLAPVVLFSAAIPGQGGVEHVNEQWQTYWAALFAQHDYALCDAVRPTIWNDRRVASWYRQNILVFCHRDALNTHPRLAEAPHTLRLSLVHPEYFGVRSALQVLSSLGPAYLSRQLRGIGRRMFHGTS